MDKNGKTYYLMIFIALGAGVGAAFGQIPIGICLGAAIGAALDIKNGKKKK